MTITKKQWGFAFLAFGLGILLTMLSPELLARGVEEIENADDIKPFVNWALSVLQYALILGGACGAANGLYTLGQTQSVKQGAVSLTAGVSALGLGGKMALGASILLL